MVMILNSEKKNTQMVKTFCDTHRCTTREIVHILGCDQRVAYQLHQGKRELCDTQVDKLTKAHEQWKLFTLHSEQYLLYQREDRPVIPESMTSQQAMNIVSRVVNSRIMDSDQSTDSTDRIILLLNKTTG